MLPGQIISIVVENQGRICFGAELQDRKGILSNITLGDKVVTNWNMTGLPLDDSNKLLEYVNIIKQTTRINPKYKMKLR